MTSGDWICVACGTKHGRYRGMVSTWHVGKCDWCDREIEVTEPRDFDYPELNKDNTDEDDN